MLTSRVAATLLPALAGFAILSIGCKSDPMADSSKAGTMDPTKTTLPSASLQDLYAKLDKSYEGSMSQSDAATSPEAKKIADELTAGKTDIKPQLTKDHKLFSDGVATAKAALIALSSCTSTQVAPMEHDAYVTYYTAVGEKISARRDEYQAILDYEAKPDDKALHAVLDAARNVNGKDLVYKTVKL